MTAAWIPGVFLGLVGLARRERRAFAGLVACGVGMAASGHPETMAHTAGASLAVAAALALGMARPLALRFLAGLAAALALTAALAAPIVLPFLEALPRSERMELLASAPDYMQPPPFAARILAPLVDPFRFGSERDGNWSGPQNFAGTCSVYAGLATLALALAGAAIIRGRILAILVGGLGALAVAVRVHPFFDLFAALPYVGRADNQRLRVFWVLAVALAAGLSLRRLTESKAARRTAAVVAAAAGLLAALLPPPSPVAPWERAWWAAALAAAAATAVLHALPRQSRWTARAILAGITVDLFLATIRYQPVVPRALDLSPPPALAYLAMRSRAAPAPFRVIAHGYDLLPNLAAIQGLWDPRGNDPMRPAEPYWLLQRRLASKTTSAPQIVLFSRPLSDVGFLEPWPAPGSARLPALGLVLGTGALRAGMRDVSRRGRGGQTPADSRSGPR